MSAGVTTAGLVPLDNPHSPRRKDAQQLAQVRHAQSQDVGFATDPHADRGSWRAARSVVDLVLDASRARRAVRTPEQVRHSSMLCIQVGSPPIVE